MKKTLAVLFIISLAVVSCKGAGGKLSGVADTLPDSVETVPKEIVPVRTIYPSDIILEKEFIYDKYTLEDVYPYKDTVRVFQWDKVREHLALVVNAERDTTGWAADTARWAVIQNRKNIHGLPPLVPRAQKNAYNNYADAYGVERYQGTPLYESEFDELPVRYAEDGSLVKVLHWPDSTKIALVHTVAIGGNWFVPVKYLKPLNDTITIFTKAAVVDRTNQNIAVLERSGDKWLIRSMNPATTGLHHPPFQMETPIGIFVIQEKKPRMIYMRDGTTQTGGFSPWASRFSNGAYIHGVPINLPATQEVEFSPTLGTTPRSHKCVRNATSHAKFFYDWAPALATLVIVIE